MKTYDLRLGDERPFTSNGNARRLLCPVCAGSYNHARAPHLVLGDDRGAAGWDGRGDLIVVLVEGECGHAYEVCLGFHKGETFVFCRAA